MRACLPKVGNLILEQHAQPLLDVGEPLLLLVRYAAHAVRPIAVHVTRAKRKRIVDQRRIDHVLALRPIQQIGQIAQMAIAAAHAIPRTVFVEHEHLAGREPAERRVRIVEPVLERQLLQRPEQRGVVELARIGADEVLHAVLARLVRVALDLRYGRVLRLGERRRWLVRLAGRPVHGHHPEAALVLVVAGVQDAVAFAHRVEEEAAALEVHADH